MARAGFYNVTAAELAERTHSIVVAPSISSNLFACDSCQLGGDPLHYAVAKLFSGDREALTASASAAAGYDVVLPQRYVIAGHSGGGQLAAGAAGYAAQIAEVNGTPLDLAGVLLLDTSEVGGAVSRGIAKIPADIPVLYITEEPSVLNDFGSVDAVLEAARPGQFNGVRLVGGTHSDAIQTTNSIVEFAFSLLTGVSRPENVARGAAARRRLDPRHVRGHRVRPRTRGPASTATSGRSSRSPPTRAPRAPTCCPRRHTSSP